MNDSAPQSRVRATARAGVVAAVACLSAWSSLLPVAAATLPTEQVIAAWAQAGKHPLVGRIWTAHDGRVVDGIALSTSVLTGSAIADVLGIKRPTYVLLGEVHDNPEHHLLRAGLIDDLAQRTAFGRMARPAVVAEHIDDGQAELLAGINPQIARGETTTEGVLEALAWDKSGWPAAALFRPLFGAIVDARLPLHPGNVPRAEIRDLVRKGPASLADERRVRFGLDLALPPPLQGALAVELKGSHCGMLPESAIEGMANAQRYRDGRMAHAMVAAAEAAGKSILLAGNGHVRTDRGAPWHIRARLPQAGIVAVMLLEVQDGKTDPLAYLPRDPDGRPAVDAVVFTPRAKREDPCEQMRAHMQKKG